MAQPILIAQPGAAVGSFNPTQTLASTGGSGPYHQNSWGVQDIASANAEHGNYIATAFLNHTFATSAHNGALTDSWNPTIAGGIGFQILTAMNLFQYQDVSLLLIIIFIIVLSAERISAALRERLA